MRKDYSSKHLEIENLKPDPYDQFGLWFKEAIETETQEANAMVLATTGKNLKPSARMVLLKRYSPEGFVFFSNYMSKKGNQLEQNNKSALLFFWPNSMRQVRIEGLTEKLRPRESDDYFFSRPLESRISSLLSKQSSPLEDPVEFEEKIKNYTQSHGDPCRPDNWGGYIVKPTLLEFWQGGINRFHDRFQYSLKDNLWKIERLYP